MRVQCRHLDEGNCIERGPKKKSQACSVFKDTAMIRISHSQAMWPSVQYSSLAHLSIFCVPRLMHFPFSCPFRATVILPASPASPPASSTGVSTPSLRHCMTNSNLRAVARYHGTINRDYLAFNHVHASLELDTRDYHNGVFCYNASA